MKASKHPSLRPSKENVSDILNSVKMIAAASNSERTTKGMHIVKKMKEVREMNRRVELSEIENVQKMLQVDNTKQARANIIENAI